MRDGVVYCRTLADRLHEAAERLGADGRRWRDTADAARATWDDAAGRDVFQRWLLPYETALGQAGQALLAAAEGHRAALVHADDAATAAGEAARHAAQALGTAQDATARATTVRAAAATARGDANFANGLAQQALAAANSLGQ